ncbi:MAG: peptidylprolyl isomerase [Gemmatimonadota bacterium]
MSGRPTREPSPAGPELTPVRSGLAHVLLALAVAACGAPDDVGEEEDVAGAETAVADSAPLPDDPLFRPASEAMRRTAPDTFRVRFGTTAGSFTIEAYRAWAPRGADRFHNLARHGFYEGARFFRVIEGFVAQFGLSGRPRLDLAWRSARIEDDSVRRSNERGTVSFASSGDNSRTTQLFVNLADNPRLDGMGFAPIGRVVEGMEVVDDLYAGYEEPPAQPRIVRDGNAFLDEEFPELDVIESVEVVGADEEGAADDGGG